MNTHLALGYDHPEPLPEGFENEVRTPAVLVEHFVDRLSDAGDVVFDPFAGFGTTLRVAGDRGRTPYGIEYEADRVAHVRETVGKDAVVQGDVLELEPSDLPEVDLCFTSPPFMVRGMTENPFRNYAGETDYEAYLADVRTAFSTVREALAPDGHVVVDVANVKYDGHVTPLAWDVAEAVSDVLHFDGEVVVTWDGEGYPDREGNFGYGYDHSYCLVFSHAT